MIPIQKALNKCVGPLAEAFSKRMEAIRLNICKAYINCERDEKTLNITSFTVVHESFDAFLDDLAENNQTWAATRLDDQNPYIDPAERKRPHPEDDNDIAPAEYQEEDAEPKPKVPRTDDDKNDQPAK